MFGKSEMDYQFDPDPIDKQTAFENLKFIHKDKNGLGALNANYCHAFANFIFFMSNPTFIRTIKQFKQNNALRNDLINIMNNDQCTTALSNNYFVQDLTKYNNLYSILSGIYGQKWPVEQGKKLLGLLKMIYLIYNYTDADGKIIPDYRSSGAYDPDHPVNVNAARLYEGIIQHVKESMNVGYQDSKLYYSFFQQCAYIMSGRKVSALSLIRSYALNTNKDIFERYEEEGMEKKLSDALRNDGDRIFVTAGGNHFFVVYKKGNYYYAIGDRFNRTFKTIKEAICAWMIGKNTNALTIDLQNPEKDTIKLSVWDAIHDIKILPIELQDTSYQGVPYINACASENIDRFVEKYFFPHDPSYLKITQKVCKQFRKYMLDNIDYIAMGYMVPKPSSIDMNGCYVVDGDGNLIYTIGHNNVVIQSQMVMNNQMMNNMGNNVQNPMMNNMGNNNMGMNNQIGMNNMGMNMGMNPQFMQPKNNMNNPMMMNNKMMNNMGNNNMGMNNNINVNNINNNMNNQINQNGMNNMNNPMMNNIGMNMGNNIMNNQMGMKPQFIPPNNMKNQMGMNCQNGMNNMNNQINQNLINNQIINNNNNPLQNNIVNNMNPKIVDKGYRDYVKSTTEMDNSPEHLFGLSCLPEISKDTSDCGTLFYWKSCC